MIVNRLHLHHSIVLLACAILAMGLHAQTRVDNKLCSDWELERYDVHLTKSLTRSSERVFLRERRWDDSMNVAIEYNTARIVLELHCDSTYSYKHIFNKHVEYFERGSWSMSGQTFHALSTTHDDPSILDGATVSTTDDGHLVLVFRLGTKRDGLQQHIRFRRRTEQP